MTLQRYAVSLPCQVSVLTYHLQRTSIANALTKAIDSYEAAIETQSDVKSAVGAFYTYARTRDGIPEVVTATGTEYTRYTTLPDW